MKLALPCFFEGDADLKRISGDIDILDKQIALEQAIVGSPLIMGNKVVLLQDGTATYAAMFAAIRSARDHINLESYIIENDEIGRQVHLTGAYFVPAPQLLKALTDAARRGVDVRLILPGHSDSALVFQAGRSYYSMRLKAGVKIFERRGALLHSKTALIDGVWSCVGSTNLDWRSFVDNDGVNAAILGRDFAQQKTAMITRDLEASEAITLAHREQRSLLLRIKEWGASLLQRLL